MGWNQIKRDYLTFTKGGRNGFLVLITALLFVIFASDILKLFKKEETVSYSEFFRQADSLQAQMDKASLQQQEGESPEQTFSERDGSGKGLTVLARAELFNFDPNTITAEDWKKLGLSDKVIKTISNYKAKGGKFYKKEDLKKIYGLKESDYNRLEPYIQIASTPSKENSLTYEEKKSNPVTIKLVDLNTADSLQLVSLNGIGAILSSRILKFRNNLGGFYSVEQLHEVYGLKPETFDLIKDKISVEVASLKKININTVTLEELKLHPYFKSPVAQTIISYREQHGAFASAEELKNVDAVTEEIFQKILPYINL